MMLKKLKIIVFIVLYTFIISITYTYSSNFLYVPGTKVIKKVIAGSDNVIATSKQSGGKKVFKMGILIPYYVLAEKGDSYKITDQQKGGKEAYVKKSLVLDWNTREGMHFQPSISMLGERTDIKVWPDRTTIEQFAKTGNEKRFGASYTEERRVSRALPKKLLPYPIVDSTVISTVMGSEKKIYKVYIPAYIPETKVEVKATSKQVEAILSRITFCIVFDATASMKEYAVKMAETIEELIKSVDVPSDKVQMGFIFFKDIGDKDPVKMIIPTSVKKGIITLREESIRMSGGGDGAEPILDAMVLAVTEFKWEGETGQSGARKVIISVLNTDAKPNTVGLSEAIGAGQTLDEAISLLQTNDITVFSLQAGPEDAGSLVTTLAKLANSTAGEFYPWDTDSEKNQSRRDFADKIKRLMKGAVDKVKKDAEDIASVTIPSDRGYSVLPLKAVNAEILNRLRAAAVKYKIEEGGFIVREGWMFEKEDLYQEQILVEKELLEKLIRIFSFLSEAGAGGEDLSKAVKEDLKAILGEDISKTAELQEIIEKKLGIHFNTNLLGFSIEYLYGLTPKERLTLGKRIKEAGKKIENFLEAATPELDSAGHAWMKLSYLP